jgi:hypothetical protein
MISTEQSGGRLPWKALASGIVVWAFSVSSGIADDGVTTGPVRTPKNSKTVKAPIGPGVGTLGYGPPGLHPGFQGFGLGYHLGYGYGGSALGVGAEGGYPFYGGPGYPHPWPRLQRCGPIAPFCYFGGPGYPTPEHPNYFGGIGPLTPDQPVVTFENNPNTPPYAGGYGQFDGTLPYPETTFAPYTTIAGEGGSASGVSTASPSTAPPIPSTDAGRALGFDAETFDYRGRAPGLKVNVVVPGGLSEKAGLHLGDVIQSINGYLTQRPSDLSWIIEKAASGKILKMTVRTTSDGKEHEITIRLP